MVKNPLDRAYKEYAKIYEELSKEDIKKEKTQKQLLYIQTHVMNLD
ncbi:MAG: hypothetical protein ACTSQE_04795 [Candidatus Heimdallarchaeaceae archaeon]